MREAADGGLVAYVSPEPGSYVRGTNRILFHSDIQCSPSGPIQSVSLYAMEMDRTEPTLFADMAAAAKALPQELRERVQDLEVVQALNLSIHYDESARTRLSDRPGDTPISQYPHSPHPVLGKHRVTGEPVVNVSQLCSSHIAGMDDMQSDTIFSALEAYQYDQRNIYAHEWQRHDLVIWDNIALQHARNALGAETGRRLRRVSVNAIDLAEMLEGATSDTRVHGESAIAAA